MFYEKKKDQKKKRKKRKLTLKTAVKLIMFTTFAYEILPVDAV